MSGPILYAEVNGVCILFLLLLSFMSGKSMYLLSERRSFLLIVFSNILLFALDVFWIFINESALQVPSIWNWIVNALYYTVSGLAGFLWFYYSETIQKSKLATNKRYLLIAFLPEILLATLSATAYLN